MSLCIIEEIEPGLDFRYDITEVIASTTTKWQKVDVVNTKSFGKALLIDGLIQSSDVDEFVYHECLVHPAMLSHPNPKTVFIGGGGEGSTAREVLKHKTVEKCVMVDIDGEVVDFCKKALTQNEEAFADPRLELIIDDAKKQLEETGPYDVIIMDLDDPLEDNPCYHLYTKEFYEMCKSKLTPGGVFVTQSSSAGVKMHKNVFAPVNKTVREVFPVTTAYSQAVWSFCDEWGWNMGYKEADHKVPTPEEIDARIAERVKGELTFLNGESFTGICCLSKAIRKTCNEETRVLTAGQHVFLSNSLAGIGAK